MSLIRTGTAWEQELLEKFDLLIKQKGDSNRSEAIRDLARDHFVDEDVASNRVVVATLTLIYDHHQPKLSEQLIAAQHDYKGQVLATTHVPITVLRSSSSETGELMPRNLRTSF